MKFLQKKASKEKSYWKRGARRRTYDFSVTDNSSTTEKYDVDGSLSYSLGLGHKITKNQTLEFGYQGGSMERTRTSGSNKFLENIDLSQLSLKYKVQF